MSSNLHSIFLEELCHENCFSLFFAHIFYCSFLFFHCCQGCSIAVFVFCTESYAMLFVKGCLNFCLRGLLLLCSTPRLGSKDKKQEMMIIFLFVCSYLGLIFPLAAVLTITESTFDLFELSFCIMAF